MAQALVPSRHSLEAVEVWLLIRQASLPLGINEESVADQMPTILVIDLVSLRLRHLLVRRGRAPKLRALDNSE